MPRNLDGLKVLHTVDDVINCLREDPLDRVLLHGNDLCPEDFNDCIASRVDDSVLIIRSLRAIGAVDIKEFVQTTRTEGYPYGPHIGEIAVVGTKDKRTRFGRTVPEDIEKLLREAEEKTPDRLLSWAGYEGLCVLAGHPEAEKGDGL